MTNRSFQDQIQDLWRTRPTRIPSSGHVAGVCSGIGYRYGIDPVLVRVAFVVATIVGGSGILLYLAGWLVLPKEGERTSPAEALFGKGECSESGTKTVMLLVALAIAASTIGPAGVGLGGSGIVSLALMLGGLWLLYQRQPLPPAQTAGAATIPVFPAGNYTQPGFPAYSPYTKLPDQYTPDAPPTDAPPTQETPAPVELTKPEGAHPSAEHPSTTAVSSTAQPPAWDPLGVAPFAWDLPEPKTNTAPAIAVDAPRSRLTPVTIGLAIIAAAIATGISVGTNSEWLSPGRIGAIALAVVGAGLLLGGILRRGYGLLIVTAPLAGFVVLASLIGPLEFDERTMGEQLWTPATAAAIEPEYSIRFGSGTLDLRATDLDRDTTVNISSQFGEIIVLLPATMNVLDHCDSRVGHAQCLTDGVTIDGGSDGTDGPVLTLNADSRFGSVEVLRD